MIFSYAFAQPAFIEHQISTLPSAPGPAPLIHLNDIDGDGDMDVLGMSNMTTTSWYENDGNQSYTEHIIVAADGPFIDLHSNDIDMDGDVDVIIANTANIRWFENIGGNLSTDGYFITQHNNTLQSFLVEDYDNDGDVDIITLSTTHLVSLYRNDGSGNFTSSELISASDLPEEPYILVAEDMNNDGYLDIIISGYFVCSSYLYINDGSEGFYRNNLLADCPYHISTTDLDDDGAIDILTAEDGSIYWYWNDGQGNFEKNEIELEHPNQIFDFRNTAVNGVDLDMDGDKDLVSSYYDDMVSGIVWYENDGSENIFTKHIVSDLVTFGYDVKTHVGDINGDGLPDILSGANYNISWFEQVTIVGNTFIPDDNFEQALIDLGLDDVLDDSVASNNIYNITELNLYNKNILDLAGIEDFEDLETLDISHNIINYLDLSNNTKIKNLYCNDNNLSFIDLSNNSDLISLFIQNNQLLSLDLSNNYYITEIFCFGNSLTSLDLRNGAADLLTEFNSTDNSLECILVNEEYVSWAEENLTLIDDNVYFDPECLPIGYTFVPDDNFEQTLIEFGYDDVLDDSVLTSNIYNITELDIMNRNINNLTGIENFTNLEVLLCNGNNINNVDLSNNTLLTTLWLGNNYLNSIDLSNNILIEQLVMSHNQIRNINLEFNTSLKSIHFDHNDLSNIDVSNKLQLETLILASNRISYIDVSNNLSLKAIDVNYNQLTSLDLSNNQLIQYIACNDNQLSNLDISQNSQLGFIRASANSFESLDFSNNPLLEAIEADHNLLTSIDLSNNPELLEINLWANQLNNLDLSNNPLLTHISLQDNNLTELSISNNLLLTNISVQHNNLNELLLNNNTNLEFLQCDGNSITSLDLSDNSMLNHALIGANQLTSLNLKSRHPSDYEFIWFGDNPELSCVDVLDPNWATINWGENEYNNNLEFKFICGSEERSVWHISPDGSNSSGDGSIENPLGTIQQGIYASMEGDSIRVNPGIYFENITWEDKDLSLIGSGSSETIIDAMQITNGAVILNVSHESIFKGFTVRNGAPEYGGVWPRFNGGGICMHNAHLTLKDIIVEDCVLPDQEWENGNGIFIGGSSSSIEDVIVRNNQGGGIALGGNGSYPSFNNVLIEHNTQGYGMRVYDTGVIMQNSEISNNIAGGIWYEGVGFNPSIYSNNIFSKNGSENSGFGALKILNAGAEVLINGCLFVDNNSNSSGSDIYSQSFFHNDDYIGNDIEITNSVFYNQQNSSIFLQGTATEDTLNINYSNILNEESITVGNGNHIEYGLGMIFEDPLFCNDGDGIDVLSPLIGAGPDGGNIANLMVECGFEPKITRIVDIPNDQGGRVYLDFIRSPFDNEGDVNQLYTIFRMDIIDGDSIWVAVASGAAIGNYNYTFEVLTLHDSTSIHNGLTHFKVVVSVDEGIFHSNVSAGYSIDNIVPMIPTGMLAASVDNYISIEWDISPDEDFQYFELVRSGGAGDDIVIELVETSYEDFNIDAGIEYSYKIAAYDYNGNFSGYSDPVLVSMLSAEDNGLVPASYVLNQNYPNPFNPTTQINYELPNNDFVSINIYDVMGHRIKSLVSANQDAGYKSIHWNATNDLGQPVSAGMYVYTIQAGEFRQTRKMVLLK